MPEVTYLRLSADQALALARVLESYGSVMQTATNPVDRELFVGFTDDGGKWPQRTIVTEINITTGMSATKIDANGQPVSRNAV